MKKNLLTVLILALLLVNVALTAVMMISVTSTNNKTAALVNTIATVMNLELTNSSAEEEAEVTVSLADTEVYPISTTMTIPLAFAEGEKQVHMVCNISLSVNKKHDDYKSFGGADNLAAYETLIQGAIVTVVSSKTESEIRSDMEGLRKDILKAIQKLYDSDFIYNVTISEVKFG